MSRRRIIILAIPLFGTLSLAGIFFYNHHLAVERHERESNFIAIHFLATEALIEGDPDGSQSLDDLIRPYGGTLMRPFPDGLIYHSVKKSFTLEEPKLRRVSLFCSDRLIATDRKWPRWEATGEYAKKIPGHHEPPPGYE